MDKARVTFRVVKVYENDSIKREMDYELTIKAIDSGWTYQYRNLKDENKNMEFKYFKNSNRLVFAGSNLGLYQTGEYLFKKSSSEEFELFVLTEQMLDGHGPVLFNENYGVLSSNNGWGMDFLFLPNKAKTSIEKQVLKNIDHK